MKKEDLLKEKEELEQTILFQAVRIFVPIVNIISAIQRHMYIANEVDKITPKPAPIKPEKERKLSAVDEMLDIKPEGNDDGGTDA